MSQTAGGAATASGMDYQHRATAWVAVLILAEKAASPPWGLPSTTTLDWFRSETEQPVDDLLVVTSAGGVIFAQIKHRLHLSQGQESDLASALDQCVRQFIACQTHSHGTRPWERSLDPTQDRLVVITGSNSSVPIRTHLPAVLDKLQSLPQNQLLDDVARNQDEQKSLSVVLDHIKRSWHDALGTQPTDSEIRQLLRLIRIQVLNVDHGGASEQEAKDRLRTAVLRYSDQADTAWSQLIVLCARLAADRSGTNRSGLQQALVTAGIEVQTASSYREDISRIKEHSLTTVALLSGLARIRIGTDEVKLLRRSTDKLRCAAAEGSLPVVGEPGAGKSGTLHDLTQMLLEQGQDVVFLAVDHLSAQSLDALRGELGLEHNLADVLANWPGMNPAFLIIDALDAARAELTARAIRDLIQLTVERTGRWRVVASIRKFDLRYNQELRHLFLGAPPTAFHDPEFSGIRHLNVPKLSDEEFAEIQQQSPDLAQLIDHAPQELRELLRVPFNLRIMAELLGAGLSLADLTPIRTQLELLDQYWTRRVIRDDKQGDARESILRRTCKQMVQDRTLRVNRSRVVHASVSVHVNDLLSTQVLTEGTPDRYVLMFSHHVLFDYAVARLLLRGDDKALVTRLTADPELVIVIRPSLLLHYQHLWTWDPSRKLFWQLVFRLIQANELPEIGKLIGPAVGGQLAKILDDLEPLCIQIENSDIVARNRAEQVLTHLIGALLVASSDQQPLLGPDAGPWCEMLERASRHLRASVVYAVRSLLSTLCDYPERFTSAQRIHAGKTARRLLEFAWTHQPRDQWLVIHALQAVCRTFESNPTDSASLLRQSLELEHLEECGFEEMPWLAREVKRLIPLDSALVEDMYKSVFAYREPSKESTPIGRSRILPMTSNRRQVYEMALYGLAEAFSDFLAQTPRRATSTLIAVMETYVDHHYARTSREVEVFMFHGREARIRVDNSSSWWDAGNTYRHDNSLKMLDVFGQHLEYLAEHEASVEEFREILEVLVNENQLAVFWRRLLLLGARFPSTIGREILPLAWAMPILTSRDTTTAVGEFLKVIFSRLNSHERKQIEQSLLSIPDTYPMDHREYGEHAQHRLLGCLITSDLITDAARQLLTSLQATNNVPVNEPTVRMEGIVNKPFGEEEYLAYKGVPVDEESNRRIREFEQPVKAFADRHRNAVPNTQDVAAIFPILEAFYTALSRADTDGVHPMQQAYAWSCLTNACGPITNMDEFTCNEPVGTFVQTILVEASRHADPPHIPEYDTQFDEEPSWGTPAVRIEAAQGLMGLARQSTCATAKVLQAIVHLSADPVPAVRFQIAIRLNALYRTAPELMWQVVEYLSREESSRGVLQGILSGPLNRLAGAHPNRVIQLTKAIYDRVQQGPGAKRVRELCLNIFTSLYIWRDHDICHEIISSIIVNLMTNLDEAQDVLRHFRDSLTHGPVDPPDPQQEAIRQRTFDLLKRFLDAVRNNLCNIQSAHIHVSCNSWPENEQENAQILAQLINYIGQEIYFASGAYDLSKQGGAGNQNQLTHEERERFYREAGSILDSLAEVGLPGLAHHLLETLEAFIPFDPKGVFLQVGQVIRGAEKEGYQYESLAVDLMVRLVEQYLAEYRDVLRENEECRQTLLAVLDIFVKAGWPSARRLTYRLEEIFR